MPIKLMEPESPITTDDFYEFAKSINAHPSRELMEFYLINNGGFIDNIPDTSPGSSINSFLSIKYGEATIDNTYKQLIKGTPSLLGLIPFAYDDCGNLFLLSTNSNDNGRVYLWLPDEGEKVLLCETFNDFLETLNPE